MAESRQETGGIAPDSGKAELDQTEFKGEHAAASEHVSDFSTLSGDLAFCQQRDSNQVLTDKCGRLQGIPRVFGPPIHRQGSQQGPLED